MSGVVHFLGPDLLPPAPCHPPYATVVPGTTRMTPRPQDVTCPACAASLVNPGIGPVTA